MKLQSLIFFSLVSIACIGIIVSPVRAEVRNWTSTAGTTIQAEFVRAEGDKIILKKTNGKELTVKLSQLSISDRDYIKSRDKDPSLTTTSRDSEPQLPAEKDQDPSATDSPKTKLKITKSGRGLKRALRFAPALGQRQESQITTTTKMKGMPTERSSIESMNVVTRANEGSFDVEIEIVEIEGVGEGDPKAEEIVRKMMMAQKFTQTYNSFGEIIKSMSPLGEGPTLVFPKEEVGVGAEWVVEGGGSGLMAQIFNLESRYRIKSIQGTQIEIGVTMKIKPGAKEEGLEMSLNGSGVIVVDTTKPLPLKSRLKMDMDMMGDEGSVTTELTTK
jgi:hypothetical protein